MIDCAWCGSQCTADAKDTSGSWAPIRIELGICNICAIQEERARKYADGIGTKWLIINGELMSPDHPVTLGDPDPDPGTPSNWKGCSGARWDYQRFGEEPMTTYSMWIGGKCGDRQRDRMPDNGRLLTSEEVVKAIEARQGGGEEIVQENSVNKGDLS